LSYGHHGAGSFFFLCRRERPRPSRGVAFFHTRRDDGRPAGPAYLPLPLHSLHPPPALVVPERKSPRPACCAGGAACARSRLTARGITPVSDVCHGPPALVPSVPPVLPDPTDGRMEVHPHRSISFASRGRRRGAEPRSPWLRGARRPGTGHGRSGRRSGVVRVEGGHPHHICSTTFSVSAGGAFPAGKKQKRSRVIRFPGPRFLVVRVRRDRPR